MKQRTVFRLPVISTLFRGIAKLVVFCLGWRILVDENETKHIKKAIIIAAPHTSNWDFPVMLSGALMMKMPVNWMGKHSLFEGPIGPVMRFLGGVPVDRRSSQNYVDQMVEAFTTQEELALLIAPEGTRKLVDRWRTGFYHMAHNAGVPIVFAYVDYQKKEIGVLNIERPTGDIEADIARYQKMYENKAGKNPYNYHGYKPED